MKKHVEHSPPRWAEALLTWYCKPELLEDLQGDLYEYFIRNVKSKGIRKAKLIYIIDVFKFFRLYTIRKPKLIDLLLHWIMLGSYVKTSSRNLLRNRLFSVINITGLAISLTVGLLLAAALSDLFSYDTFHTNNDRIHRLISKYSYQGRESSAFNASSSLRAGMAIKESIPAIEEVAILRRGFAGDVTLEEKTVPLVGFWANEATLQVFTFPLVLGNPHTALQEPFSIILTETTAKKFSPDGNVLGKVIQFNHQSYTVTGIAKDLPRFSHLRFDLLASLNSRQLVQEENNNELAWDNMWNHYIYLLVREDGNLDQLQNDLNAVSAREDKTVENVHIKLALQPLKNIVTGDELNNSIGPVLDSRMLWITGILTFLILLSACFNYSNLSLARSLKRSREVGIRKVLGALNKHVLVQFITESVIISFCALVISIVLFVLLKPYILSVNPQIQQLLHLELTLPLLLKFVVLAIVVGILAGFFPALFFSRIHTLTVLKNLPQLRIFQNVSLRKALLVFQYTISLMFITATIIGYKQYVYMMTYDLGFQTENIINIPLQDNNPKVLMKEILEIPEVNSVSRSAVVTGTGNFMSAQMKTMSSDDAAIVFANRIDDAYLPQHAYHLLAGRNFIPLTANPREIIINETAMKHFNIGGGNPANAVGEKVMIDNEEMTVTGVVKDFHYSTLEYKITDAIFIYDPNIAQVVNVKIMSGNRSEAMAKLESVWRKIDDVHPMNATFYEDVIEQTYNDYAAMIKIISVLAFVAITIASMGLFGMVVFTTETKLKEISIRKVLGASNFHLLFMLSKGFLYLLLIAAVVSLPATYLYFDRLVLSTLACRTPISVGDMSLGLVLVVLLALTMIITQTIRTVIKNPAEVLKSE